jgi:hypothetical protein
VPRKAAYLEFESSADAEFEFFLAEHLHKTVAEIGEMSNEEFMRWNVYLGRKAQMAELEAKGG